MSNKSITIDIFDTHSIQEAIDVCKQARKDLATVKKNILNKLAETGVNSARTRFAFSNYDGDNDVEVTCKVYGNRAVVNANGQSVLFIEFGTGVYNAPVHPDEPEFGFARGGYGKGNGKKQTWVYKGNPGTNGRDLGNGRVLTYGNGANLAMYESKKDIERNIANIVKGEIQAWLT